jgi:hypothetical protein
MPRNSVVRMGPLAGKLPRGIMLILSRPGLFQPRARAPLAVRA